MSIMTFFRKTKGSISIFLCLVMLPMVTYATMIVDASRLQAAKAAISGAGDLTMNAALSEYEKVLKDMYGLFAMVQNDSDLEPALQSYFEQTIEGGLSGTNTNEQTIQAYAKVMTNWVLRMEEDGELDFDNLLAMDVEQFSMNNVSSSAIANPAVMKRQIVDYMKYKGPVSLASTLFSKLSFLKNSSAQTEVLEKKVDYSNSLNEVQTACDDAWKSIDGTDGYNKLAKGLNDLRENNGLEDAVNKALVACREGVIATYFVEYSPFMLQLLANRGQGGTPAANNSHIDYNTLKTSDDALNAMTSEQLAGKLTELEGTLLKLLDYTADGKDSFFEKVGGPVELNYDATTPDNSTLEFTQVNELKLDFIDMKEYVEDLQEFETELNKGDANIDQSKLFELMCDHFLYQSALIQYEDIADEYYTVMSDFQSVYSEYERVLRKYNNTIKDELRASGVAEADLDGELSDNEDYTAIQEAASKAKQAYKHFSDVSTSDSVHKVYTTYSRLLQSDSEYKKAADYFLSRAKTYLQPFYDKVTAINAKLAEIQTNLDAVITAMQTAEQEKIEWGNSLNNVDDGATKASMQSDFDTSTDGISIDDVKKLKGVVTGYQTFYSNFQAILEAISFSSTSILKGTLNYDSIKTMANAYLMTNYAAAINNETYATSRHNKIIEAAVYYTAATFYYGNNAVVMTDGQNVYIADGGYATAFAQIAQECGYLDGFKDNTSEVFEDEKFIFTLKSICDTIKTKLSETEQAEQDQKVNNINDVVTSGEDTKISDDASSGASSGADSGSDDEDEEEAPILIGDILTRISEYCDKEDVPVQNIPDDLDNSEAKSIKVSSSDESGYQSQGKSSSNALKSAKDLLSQITQIGETVTAYAYMEEYFTEMFSCDTDRIDIAGEPKLTLSGTTLNPDTNWYGKEVEYMLWGNADLNANVTANYAMIYMIRFALNAIYAFTAPDIQSFALEVATAVAGWTVIGVPIVQAVVTIALALAESGVDIAKLKNGEDVPIYKNASTFVCSPSGIVSGVVQAVADKAVKTAAAAVEERIDNFVDKAGNKLKGKIADNVGEIESMINDYASSQLDSISTTVKNMYVTPLINQLTPIMNELSDNTKNIHDLVDSAVDKAVLTVKQNIDAQGESLMKTIENEVYEKIIAGGYTDLMKNKIEDYFNNVEGKLSPSNVQELIEGQLRTWESAITDKVSEYTSSMASELKEKIYENMDSNIEELKNIIGDKMTGYADQISGAITDSLDGMVTQVTDAVDTSSASAGVTLNYKEYCKIFVFLKIALNEESMLQRCGALVEANVRAADEKHASFDITNAFTLMYVDAKVNMHTLFPWGVETELNDVTGNNSFGFGFGNMTSNDVKIHYSGVNGY